MATEDDLTLDGGYKMLYIQIMYHRNLYILETYMILLNEYHPNKFNKN